MKKIDEHIVVVFFVGFVENTTSLFQNVSSTFILCSYVVILTFGAMRAS